MSFLLSRSHRQGRKSEKRPKPKESSSKKGKAPAQTQFSFVFVVNELSFIEEGNGTVPNVDRWGNPLPPNTSQSYGSETPGKIWRYRNGSVSLAGEGFSWYRESPGLEGAIWGPVDMTTDDGQRYWGTGPLEEHSTFSVFNCWRFLPCLYADVDVTTIREMGVDNLAVYSMVIAGQANGIIVPTLPLRAPFEESWCRCVAIRSTLTGQPWMTSITSKSMGN
ncbi:hypothetical protein CGGC5_v002727 [Colletotrichum fructicola Nara gc5]|uniref:Uncharacterized protein n=1 Tax=Colletotrichum fructicola (strain Nara gc5) TaxID=1213859 RepID=A0A7J6JK24_COLFN|nr:hypothetical protein CGGC5_v002727 [Colletotrichum fructicola Nara gc5]